jgi:sulfatase maturation enzyme AslB (radical SAM superfamily)
MKKPEIRKKLDESVKKNHQVIFSGGEPTINKDMLKIARYASSAGFTELNLQTNATVCSDIDYAMGLVLAGVNFALVSLHSDKAEVSDGLTRTPGSFKKTLAGIRNLLDLGVDVTLAHVINTKNHARLSSFVEFVSSRFSEIRKIDLLFNAFRGRGALHPELLPKLSIAIEGIKKGYARATELGISLRNAFSLPLCYFPFGLEDSYEYVTLKKIKQQGREMPENLRILAHEKHKSSDCKKCIYNDYCLGIWKSYADHHSDSELKPFSDAFCAPEYGFSGSYLVEHDNEYPGEILRRIRQGKYRPLEPGRADYALGKVKSTVLIFKNIMNCKDKEDVDWFYQGSLYLISALTAEDIPVKITDSRISLLDDETITDEEDFLDNLSDDVNLVVISLSEFYIKKAASLIRLIREKSDAFVAVGGIMPTNTPEHVCVHLPDADFVVRGAGERILPRIVKILSGKKRGDRLSEEQKTSLSALQGLFANLPGCFISAESNMVNYLDNLDETRLDLSVLSEKNVREGLNLSTSRGCFNNCLFCTTVGRGRFRAMSYPGLIKLLMDYRQSLVEIFGDVQKIPKNAYKLSFNDDDFLGDKKRAALFFDFIRRSEFSINFIQTAIRSFYVRRTIASDEPELDMSLMECLGPDLFHPESDHNIYIGTENFSDDEISRLNKGYSYRYIKRVVHELSKRRIKQGHHLIFCNPDTRISDIFDNMIKITRLCVRYKGYFKILLPVIQSQVSLFGSASYKRYKDHVKIGEVLMAGGFPEHDYPLVLRDIPKDRIVHMLSEKTDEIFSGEKYHLECWQKSLFLLLESAERLSLSEDPADQGLASKMYFIVDSYSDYPKKIFPEDRIRRKAFRLERNNLEIMLSRKCQLRCRYCPVDKNDRDISLEDLKRSIDLLMKSDSDRVRVDFLGGEPLLRFDLIKAGIEYAEKEAKKHSKNVSYFMITNTIALDDTILDYIKRYDFLLELSLDGDEKTHNEFKIPVDRSINPYRTMTQKFKGILSSGIKNYVIMVATPKTVSRLFANFRHIRSFGFTNIHINYAFGVEWEEEELEMLFSELERIRKEYSEDLLSGRIHLGNLETRVEPAIINSELMVEWDGSIHLMTEWIFENSKVNDRDLNVGHIANIESFSDLYFDGFMSYWVLSKKYTRENAGMKKIILNNMDVGRRCAEFFSRWKKELGIKDNNLKKDDQKARKK